MIECRIVQRETHYNKTVIRPGKPYLFSEIFIVADGRSYYSRTWDVLPDTPHERAHQIEAFKQRRAMYARQRNNV